MSPSPHTVGRRQTAAFARDLMREHQIRHLPVLEGGKLVGVISDRDIRLLESFRDVQLDEVPVEEATTDDVYAVTPDTPLTEVAQRMAEHKYGSAVVVEGHTVVGIFTTIDAMRFISELDC